MGYSTAAVDRQITSLPLTAAFAYTTSILDMAEPMKGGVGLLEVAKNFMEAIQGCNSIADVLVSGMFMTEPFTPFTRDDIFSSYYEQNFAKIISAGNKDIQGPMLVIPGTADGNFSPVLTIKYVNKTCQDFSNRQLHHCCKGGTLFSCLRYTTEVDGMD